MLELADEMIEKERNPIGRLASGVSAIGSGPEVRGRAGSV
jgi:hypothetical protein